MSKHTPGPWMWSGDHLYGGEGALDCVIESGIAYGDPYVSVKHEDRTLIAAAPDLLEAVGWLAVELVRSCETADLMTDEAAECLRKAELVRKKARGE